MMHLWYVLATLAARVCDAWEELERKVYGPPRPLAIGATTEPLSLDALYLASCLHHGVPPVEGDVPIAWHGISAYEAAMIADLWREGVPHSQE